MIAKNEKRSEPEVNLAREQWEYVMSVLLFFSRKCLRALKTSSLSLLLGKLESWLNNFLYRGVYVKI